MLHISPKNDDTIYFMNNEPTPVVDLSKDLGINICSNLKSSSHVTEIGRKANQRINLIFRSFVSRNRIFMTKLYITYVRPLVEYNTSVLSPHQVCDINAVEKVQRYFTRALLGGNLSYQDRLLKLGLRTLEYRRMYFDLCEAYKLLKKGPQDHEKYFMIDPNQRTRSHSKKT